MSPARPEELARRLFAVVRGERPSDALRARIRAAGHAELERARDESILDVRRPLEEGADIASARRRRSQRMGPRRGLALGVLAAAAAGLFLYLRAAPERESGVLISAERTGAALGRPSSEHADRAESAVRPTEENAPDAPARAPLVREAPAAPQTPRAERDNGTPPDAPGSSAVRSGPAATKPAASVTPASPVSPPRASLGEQLEQLKQARAALRAGDHQRALELIDAYRAQPAGGELAAEASLLRIEALALSGQRGAAAEAARQFASDYPNSPLIDRALSYAGAGAER